MSLSGKKMGKAHFVEREFIPPDPIDVSKLPELLERIKEDKGKKEAINEIVNGHIRLALSISSRYITYFNCSHLSQDLDSAAMEGLVVAANRLDTIGHDNVTGFIVVYVHNFVSTYLRKSSIVPVPRGYDPVIVKSIGENDASHMDSFLLQDLLENLTKNEIECEIVNLKIQRYTDLEVAGILKIPATKVFRIRKKLKERYRDKRN